MALLFLHFCDLLETLEAISRHDPPLLPAERFRRKNECIRTWFSSHQTKVEPQILLSALFPAKRTDRVYLIQCRRLSRQIGRFLSLGHARFRDLSRYATPGFGDLGDCVERVQRETEFPTPPASKAVTLQQVDEALDQLASRSHFSSKDIRACALDIDHNVLTLDYIYKLLQSREMKWLTRLLLKDLVTVGLAAHANFIYSCVDARLYAAMQMHDNITQAVKALSTIRPNEAAIGDTQKSNVFLPQIGIKVGPARWTKAKGGIDHALSLIDGKLMSFERKYDGEYCQFHVDLERIDGIFQIFSKSGKDFTADRKHILPALKAALRIGDTNQSFARTCILEGELVVWSDRENTILEFHKLRKHIARSGLHIGTKEDSQPHGWEHLMVVFYDLLLLDDDAVLHRPQRDRRWLLEQVVKPIRGRTALADRHEVDFAMTLEAPSMLNRWLAEAFARRWEGLVLKPASEPYFGPATGPPGSRSPWIKLKKDCIAGIGDSADFAVVGAGYDAVRARQLNMDDAKWTHFFMGCLKNRAAVFESDAKPHFLVVDCVTSCIRHEDFRTLNEEGIFAAQEVSTSSLSNPISFESVSMDSRLPPMTTMFYPPFVFDVAGSGFDRASNRSIDTLRFPRVLKVRWDADWRDCIDADGLQSMAAEARHPPVATLDEEVSMFMDKIRSSSKIKGPATVQQLSSNEAMESSPEHDSRKMRYPHQRTHHKPPPFIRMDTDEMQHQDVQQRYGQTAESRMTSNPDMNGRVIILEDTEARKSKIAVMHSTKRKRPSLEYTATPTHSFSATWAPMQSEPLAEVANRANIGPSGTQTQLDVGSDAGERYLDLVKKHAVSTEALSGRSKRREIRYIRSSPDVEMTTDEGSSAASTQIRTLYAVASQPQTKRGQGSVKTEGLVTPPSTAEVRPYICLPKVKDCVAFMDNSRAPRDSLRTFYGQHRQLLRGFLRSIFQICSQSEKRMDALPGNVIFLINSRNLAHATQDFLDITACMLKLKKKVTIWDWRILRHLFDGDKSVELDQKVWKRRYIASMEFDDKSGDSSAAKILVKWHDGVTEYVSRSKAERLGQDLERRNEKLAKRLQKGDDF